MKSIKPLVESDTSLAFKLYQEIFKSDSLVLGRPWSESSVRGLINSDLCYGAWVGGEIKSVLFLKKFPDGIEIIFVGAHDSSRGSGLAEQLMTYAMTEHSQNWFLEVSKNNAIAINFYKKLGFVENGVRPNYYPQGDAINMIWVP